MMILLLFNVKPLTIYINGSKIRCKGKNLDTLFILLVVVINMDNLYKVSLLLDFYGQLLTKRQYEILDLYYNNDYSLGEISEDLEISRQGVHDNLKRGVTLLNKYEKKMMLLNKHLKQKKNIETLLKLIDDIDTDDNMSDDSKKKMKCIREIVINIYNDSI